MKNVPQTTACTNGLPDDEHMVFETRRRNQELNDAINLKSVQFVVLYYININIYYIKLTCVCVCVHTYALHTHKRSHIHTHPHCIVLILRCS